MKSCPIFTGERGAPGSSTRMHWCRSWQKLDPKTIPVLMAEVPPSPPLPLLLNPQHWLITSANKAAALLILSAPAEVPDGSDLTDAHKHLLRWGFHTSLHTQLRAQAGDSTTQTRQLPWSLHGDTANWLVMLELRRELKRKDVSLLKLLQSLKAEQSFFLTTALKKKKSHPTTQLPHTDEVYPLSPIKQFVSSQRKQKQQILIFSMT